MNRLEPMPTLPSGTADAVLDALPHPVIMISGDGRIANANAAAEAFFEASLPLLRRHTLGELVPFGSPLLALIEQARTRGAAVNEYKVDLGTPRNPGERLVDLHVAPLPERPDHVVIMLQERTIADKMDRQLTHRGAARSVIALAAMLAHEIKNPAVRHSRRGATAGAFGRRRRPFPDAAHLRRDRPDREACRPHGGVLRRAAGRARVGEHSRGARAREASRPVRLRASHQVRRRLRSVAAAGARQPRPAHPGLSQSGEERRRGDRRGGDRRRNSALDRVPAGRAAVAARAARRACRCRSNSASRTTVRACRTISCRTCSSRS